MSLINEKKHLATEHGSEVDGCQNREEKHKKKKHIECSQQKAPLNKDED